MKPIPFLLPPDPHHLMGLGCLTALNLGHLNSSEIETSSLPVINNMYSGTEIWTTLIPLLLNL